MTKLFKFFLNVIFTSNVNIAQHYYYAIQSVKDKEVILFDSFAAVHVTNFPPIGRITDTCPITC